MAGRSRPSGGSAWSGRLAGAAEQQLCGDELSVTNVADGSSVPVRLIELRTYGLRRMPTSAARP